MDKNNFSSSVCRLSSDDSYRYFVAMSSKPVEKKKEESFKQYKCQRCSQIVLYRPSNIPERCHFCTDLPEPKFVEL